MEALPHEVWEFYILPKLSQYDLLALASTNRFFRFQVVEGFSPERLCIRHTRNAPRQVAHWLRRFPNPRSLIIGPEAFVPHLRTIPQALREIYAAGPRLRILKIAPSRSFRTREARRSFEHFVQDMTLVGRSRWQRLKRIQMQSLLRKESDGPLFPRLQELDLCYLCDYDTSAGSWLHKHVPLLRSLKLDPSDSMSFLLSFPEIRELGIHYFSEAPEWIDRAFPKLESLSLGYCALPVPSDPTTTRPYRLHYPLMARDSDIYEHGRYSVYPEEELHLTVNLRLQTSISDRLNCLNAMLSRAAQEGRRPKIFRLEVYHSVSESEEMDGSVVLGFVESLLLESPYLATLGESLRVIDIAGLDISSPRLLNFFVGLLLRSTRLKRLDWMWDPLPWAPGLVFPTIRRLTLPSRPVVEGWVERLFASFPLLESLQIGSATGPFISQLPSQSFGRHLRELTLSGRRLGVAFGSIASLLFRRSRLRSILFRDSPKGDKLFLRSDGQSRRGGGPYDEEEAAMGRQVSPPATRRPRRQPR